MHMEHIEIKEFDGEIAIIQKKIDNPETQEINLTTDQIPVLIKWLESILKNHV